MGLRAQERRLVPIDHGVVYGNLATKLQRTMTSQIKVLSDWRRGVDQVVRNFTCYGGRQAVVAETVIVVGPNNGSPAQPHDPFAAILGNQIGRTPLARRLKANRNALKHGGATRAHRALMAGLRKLERTCISRFFGRRTVPDHTHLA